MKTKFVYLLFFSLLSTASWAGVWEVKDQWSREWEEKYSNWFASEQLGRTIFIDKKSKYYGIKADCADASYAFRAIFAKENQLPFAVVSPSSVKFDKLGEIIRKEIQILDQTSSRFDHIKDQNKRFVHFINFLADSLGSYNLREYDTYPIKLSSIKSK